MNRGNQNLEKGAYQAINNRGNKNYKSLFRTTLRINIM